ncbi:hypothetical protein [Roseovarius dicentrarchi]|uniref:hypothetical protein n=1 Tax=Roseovarius dicentrarchi TaxID=2250573 RepID=UPI000DE99C5E|nr:hypothetical protein [Roseovarius dicentrarchi]
MPVLIYILAVFLLATAAQAEAIRGSLFTATPVETRATLAGLFIGRAEGGLFADRPAHRPAFDDASATGLRGSDVQRIRALIQQAESPRDGYDAVQHGARIKPAKRPTDMTLAEVFAWIDGTPGQPHAIGRYQFIPQTLRRLVAKTGADLSQRFSPAMQDRLGDVLLVEAGLNRFRAGALDRTAFMNNLAKIWAGLPNSTGVSHYDGYAGNKAVISWAQFEAVIAALPQGLG